jgi:hypothetical protein
MTDPDRLQGAMKHALDAGAIAATVGAIIDKLPAIAAGLSVIWTAIRIYETATVQRQVARLRAWLCPEQIP